MQAARLLGTGRVVGGAGRKALEQAADRGADTAADLADDQAADAGLAAAAPSGYDVIIDFLWGGLAPLAMNHASIVPAWPSRPERITVIWCWPLTLLAMSLAWSSLVQAAAMCLAAGGAQARPGQAARRRKPVGAVQYQGSRDSWRMLHGRRGAVAITGAGRALGTGHGTGTFSRQ